MANEELIKLRKKILKNVKEELKDRLGKQPEDIERYYNEYRREFRKPYKKVSSKEELLKKLTNQDIVLCGDYHTLKQAQNTAYKIILELIKKREVVVCLELINIGKQDHLNRYLAREIEETEFLKSIKYDETWGFNWKNYRPIFRAAIENNLKVYGINKAPKSLQIRDRVAARKILDICEKHPTALIFVLYGDLHIATVHLPAQIKREMKEGGVRHKIFQIFQNSEPIYWQLLEKNKNIQADVVQLKSRSYCIQNTPPWVKLQSYLIWSEQGEELVNRSALNHFRENAVPTDEESVDSHYNRSDITREQFFYILEILCKFFKVDHSTLLDPQIYSVDDLNITADLQKSEKIPPWRYNEIVDQILIRKSYFIQEENMIFLTSYSLSHAAHAAAIYLFFQIAGIQWKPKESKEKLRERFYQRVIVDAIGFLGSKIINPKRKCFTFSDHHEYLESHRYSKIPSVMRKKQIARFTIQHKHEEDRVTSGKSKSIRLKTIYTADGSLSLGISKTIGYQLGNTIYDAMMYNIIEQPFVLELLKNPVTEKHCAYRKYLNLLRDLKDYEPVYRSKSEIF